jgi:hypothetical protein
MLSALLVPRKLAPPTLQAVSPTDTSKIGIPVLRILLIEKKDPQPPASFGSPSFHGNIPKHMFLHGSI